MNVDTDQFAALVEQTGALGRKVSTLTGRLTIMSSRLHHLDAEVAEKILVIARFLVTQGFVRPPEERHEAEHQQMLASAREARRPGPAHAKPRRDRHGLRVVGGGR